MPAGRKKIYSCTVRTWHYYTTGDNPRILLEYYRPIYCILGKCSDLITRSLAYKQKLCSDWIHVINIGPDMISKTKEVSIGLILETNSSLFGATIVSIINPTIFLHSCNLKIQVLG